MVVVVVIAVVAVVAVAAVDNVAAVASLVGSESSSYVPLSSCFWLAWDKDIGKYSRFLNHQSRNSSMFRIAPQFRQASRL